MEYVGQFGSARVLQEEKLRRAELVLCNCTEERRAADEDILGLQ